MGHVGIRQEDLRFSGADAAGIAEYGGSERKPEAEKNGVMTFKRDFVMLLRRMGCSMIGEKAQDWKSSLVGKLWLMR